MEKERCYYDCLGVRKDTSSHNDCWSVPNVSLIVLNPLSAIWRIYPSSKWSSQWPYDGYPSWVNEKLWAWEGLGHSGMFWARLSRDDFRSKLEIISFLSRATFISKSFCFPRFCKIWRQTFEPWGFWFRRCLGALFENCARSLGIFLRTPTTTTSIFWKFLFFFQSRAGVTCLTAMVIPRLSKALWWWFVEN